MINRRQVLIGAAGTMLAGSLSGFMFPRSAQSATNTVLQVGTRTIEVMGKSAKVYSLTQPSGIAGLETSAGTNFRVSIENQLDHATLIHWHGLTPPSAQDGVPELSQPALASGGRYSYDFPLERPGTYWMHSHVGLQKQLLLSAPLIVHDPAEAGVDEQNIVMMLHDFTFKDPNEILHQLMVGTDRKAGVDDRDAMSTEGMNQTMNASSDMDMDMDLNDVEFDAYLANDRTLDDPDVVRVESGGKVRLRIINAAASTDFIIDLGPLQGTLIAVDGQPIVPITGHDFEIAIAQRLDIRINLPARPGSYPILSQREGDRIRTGIILATQSAKINKIHKYAKQSARPVRLQLERHLMAAKPLSKRQTDKYLNLNLTGNMARYQWSLNNRVYANREPLIVAEGERVEITMRNQTGMAHPMHLHGHVFQVVGIQGNPINGAMRDTVMVPPKSSLTIAFDADNPGRWAFHCHNIYHMVAGMFTSLEYEA